jgi:hypothetical protein
MKLGRLVEIYERKHKPNLNALLAWYQGKDSLRAAVEEAALARWDKGAKHPHQHRLRNDLLQAAATTLLQNLNGIERCDSFDELIRLIEDKAGRLSGFGTVAIYDTALRIGGFRQLYPTDVYLHAGTRKGCKALKEAMGLTTLDCSGRSVHPSTLPEALQKLQPHEIEDFLCIYKGKFANRLGFEHEDGAS